MRRLRDGGLTLLTLVNLLFIYPGSPWLFTIVKRVRSRRKWKRSRETTTKRSRGYPAEMKYQPGFNDFNDLNDIFNHLRLRIHHV